MYKIPNKIEDRNVYKINMCIRGINKVVHINENEQFNVN